CARKKQNREQQIGERPGGNNCDPLPHVLAIECARPVRGSDVALALVDHLDVTAERNGRDRPLRGIAADPSRPDDATETNREAQHLDAGEPRDDVMTELVKGDQDAERNGEGQDFLRDVDHAVNAWRPRSSRASVRLARSASSASASEAIGCAGNRASASAHTPAMSRKPIPRSRKAATASSFAALSVAGALPPATSAAHASSRQGKRAASGTAK